LWVCCIFDIVTFSFNFRVLTISNNQEILSLQPHTFITKGGNILIVDLNNNNFENVDITNIFRKGFYCKFQLNEGRVGEVSNQLSYSIKNNGKHGPGTIDFKNSDIGSFINFPDYGIAHSELKHYLFSNINMDASSFECDCKLYPYFKLVDSDYIKTLWPFLVDDFFCKSPKRMEGLNLRRILDQQEYKHLTCDVQECPFGCTCTDAPDEHKVIVNCSNNGLRVLPEFIPIGFNNNTKVELIVKDNNITRVSKRDYLTRLVTFHLDGNDIRHFDHGVLSDITGEINMDDQQLSTLSIEFQKLNYSKIHFGNQPVSCDCSNLWIGDWVRLYGTHGSLRCKLDTGEVKAAEHVDGDLLRCGTTFLHWYTVLLPLMCSLVTLCVTFAAAYLMRFELLIVFRSIFRKGMSTSDERTILHDVFISVSSVNVAAYHFTLEEILKTLRRRNYKTFEPNTDILPGCDRDTEVTNAVNRSAQHVVVFCKDYLVDHQALKEFNDIMTTFVNDSWRNLVLINFDGLESSDIPIRRLRAVNRSRLVLSFRQTNTKLVTRLLNKLRPPRKGLH